MTNQTKGKNKLSDYVQYFLQNVMLSHKLKEE